MIETVLLGLSDRRGCGGELLIIGLNRPKIFGFISYLMDSLAARMAFLIATGELAP